METKKRFKWRTATIDEKKKRILDNFDRNTTVDKVSGCRNWNRCLSKKGYPGVFYDGKFMLASRVAWITYHGEIPKGMWICHRCDRPSCLEITHLFLGTPKENRQDCVAKGRMTIKRGKDSNFTKLTEDQVREIKQLLSQKFSQIKIGEMFGVSRGAICDISRGRNWKWVI